MRNTPCSVFRNLKITAVQVLKEVSALTILQDDVDVVGALKDVNESYNVGMLANFEDLNFPLLQF